MLFSIIKVTAKIKKISIDFYLFWWINQVLLVTHILIPHQILIFVHPNSNLTTISLIFLTSQFFMLQYPPF